MHTVFSIVKFRKDLIFVRHMCYENKILSKISLTKYLSNKNYWLYGNLKHTVYTQLHGFRCFVKKSHTVEMKHRVPNKLQVPSTLG